MHFCVGVLDWRLLVQFRQRGEVEVRNGVYYLLLFLVVVRFECGGLPVLAREVRTLPRITRQRRHNWGSHVYGLLKSHLGEPMLVTDVGISEKFARLLRLQFASPGAKGMA